MPVKQISHRVKWLLAGFGFAEERPANPGARIFKGTADDSPSP
jgi:hypothetical protein